jgi:periplasmic copper chaperone A
MARPDTVLSTLMWCTTVYAGAVGAACGRASQSSDSEPPRVVSVGGLTILDAYAPEQVTPDVGAVYLTIYNAGADDRLVGVSVSGASRAEIHDQAAEGAMTSMQPVDAVELPRGQTVRLVPGGMHVMFHDVATRYAVGDSLRVTLTFAGTGALEFRVPVIPYADVAGRAQAGRDAGGSEDP